MAARNKVIGTREKGVWVWCPRELSTEHLTKASLQLYWSGAFTRLVSALKSPKNGQNAHFSAF